MSESVTISQDPTPSAGPSQPTYDQSTGAVQGGQPQGNQGTHGDRPEWLPENFQTPEQLADSYKQLQAEYTRLSQGQQQQTQDAPSGDTGDTTDIRARWEAGYEIEVDLEDVLENALANGGLTDTDYEILEELGFPPQVADYYARGMEAETQQVVSQAYEAAGGEENFTRMVQWAASNLSSKEVEAFNKMVDSGDESTVLFAVQGLRAAFESANGASPSRTVQAYAAQSSGVSGFRSWSEVTQAMSDPRYASDPAYRSDVERRLAASSL